MTLLLLGLALWYGGHFWKRALPDAHASMGSRAKGISAGVIFASIIVMVIGYRMVDAPDLWAYPPMFKHINSLMVLVAIYFMSPGPKKGALFYKLRHPMLLGFILWAGAHLIVNSDIGSIVLFVTLAIWAGLEMLIINRADPNWTPGPKGVIAKDAMFLGASLVLTLVIGLIHGLLGPAVF